MNNTFNLTRFLSYFKKHSIDNGKTYLLSTMVMVGIFIVSLFFVVAMSNGYLSTDWQMTVLLLTVLLGGSIFTSLTFADMGNKRKAIPALTLPVSTLEKYLVHWIYTYLIFLIVALSGFYMVDIVAVKFSIPSYDNTPARLIDLSSKETPGKLIFITFTVFHAFAFWGAVFFNKMHFIKTAFVFFIGVIIISTTNRIILASMTDGHVSQSAPFQSSRVNAGNQTYYFPDNPIQNVAWMIFVVVILLLWVSAYYRLKEKQV